jgi:two-component system, LuxR family, response regulator FixJ
MEHVRIYVVDDDESVRASLTFLLQSHGMLTRSFAGGEELLGQIGALEPGIVLLDLCMSGRNGAEVQAELARRGAGFPVVAMTGADNREDESRSIALGAVDLLRKPFDEDRLLSALAQAAGDVPVPSS